MAVMPCLRLIRVRQIPINLIRADVVKAKGRLTSRIQPQPIGAGGFEQAKSAHDIGLDEFARAIDGPIDMAFGCQMHHRIGLVLGKNAAHRCAVANINLLKGVALAGAAFGQRFEIACVG